MPHGMLRGGNRSKTPNEVLLTESNISNNTSSFYGLPPAAGKVCPVSFGIKFSPPKLGLQYHYPGRPEEQLLYEVLLMPFINKGLNCEQIVSKLFEVHKDYINAKVIARKQVERLVERVLARLQPSQNRQEHENKENSPSLNNSQKSTSVKEQSQPGQKNKLQILFDQN